MVLDFNEVGSLIGIELYGLGGVLGNCVQAQLV